MTALAQLGIIDIRGALPAPLRIAKATGTPQGTRAATRNAVLHYNGGNAPDRAGGTQPQIVSWLRDVVIPNHIQRIGADGVQYHLWVARDGKIYQLRNLDALLWHCGSYTYNSQSVAVHVPIGGTQKPTAMQWQRTTELLDALCVNYAFVRGDVRGHLECGKSECPGAVLMPMLRLWRNGGGKPPVTPAGAFYTIKPGGGTLRTTPFRNAANIKRNIPAGASILVVANATGESVLGSTNWFVTHDGAYLHSSAATKT